MSRVRRLSGSSVSRSSSRYKGCCYWERAGAGFSSAIPHWGSGLAFVAFGVVSWYSSQGNEFSVPERAGGMESKRINQTTVTRPTTASRSEGTKILGWDGPRYLMGRHLVMCVGCERSAGGQSGDAARADAHPARVSANVTSTNPSLCSHLGHSGRCLTVCRAGGGRREA